MGSPPERATRPTKTIANYEYLNCATPVARANIIVEARRDGGYNAIIMDKVSRKSVIECRKGGSTISRALQALLQVTCVMIATSKEDPERWREVASITRPFVVPTPPPDNGNSDDETSNDEDLDEDVASETPIAPVRGRKRPASAMNSGSDNEPLFAGFPRLPSVLDAGPRTYDDMPLLPPVGDARLAAAACASLPPQVSEGAKRLLYGLVTYPQCPVAYKGVSLLDLMKDTGLNYDSLELWAKELEAADKACSIPWARATWEPKDLPHAFLRIASVNQVYPSAGGQQKHLRNRYMTLYIPEPEEPGRRYSMAQPRTACTNSSLLILHFALLRLVYKPWTKINCVPPP